MLWRGHALQGTTSLADVPFWRKPTERLTTPILPQTDCFLKPKSILD
jgi:hypothetical protein